ncbi:heat shock protein [Leishmania donovani]|uniref:Uncharacterized protein n=3 Tax=Leishmania donovani species complex TaxID=38574 RepID=A4HS76_LEIIN|nr:conserved hypothetical protein [Leishmania infantum JPCM5]TPP43015.1 hypothetical protein CGC20_9420 [Leishmania donovani]CAC9441648.1 hypothetical_protein_-_conserved [Leishmania infantum]CAJ1985925.1 heat shock protein [Leishmania donovani]CAM65104.1 conserved hypothetical protein [Leishmania infantum JPCM5]SUZ38876.1 hypothetical_protein_-_conserved [Leishmania infantum]|eukprot:XP_001462918.1 conserved hypothetical protein [Leishmania infantum JPCM5]
MGSNVSVLLHADTPVPNSVITTQHKVRASSNFGGSSGDVVVRCPKIRVMAAEKVKQLLRGSRAAKVAWAAKRASPLSAEESPVLVVADCAAPGALTTSRTYVPVLNAILDYAEAHRKARAAPADAPSGSKVVCPIGIEFDPTLCLGDRLNRSEARAACTEYCKLFFTHLIDALENVGKEVPVIVGGVVAPPRLSILYLDVRSCRLDDTTGPWLASSLIMRAVRRARPYALVSARANAAGSSEDGFMSYFSPDVKADMVWASLQHVLLAHNNMSIQGVEAVLENLLADDAMHDVLLQQQGVDAKALKSKEVIRALTHDRLFPRQDSQLLPHLYLVDVRYNQYSDAELQRLQGKTPASVRDESARRPITGTAPPSQVPVPTPGLAPLRQPREVRSGVADVSPTEYGHQPDADSHRYSAYFYARPTVSQAQHSSHSGAQAYMKLSNDASIREVWDGHNGAAPDAIFASNPSSSATSSPVLSAAMSQLSMATTSTESDHLWAKKASAATPPPPSTDARERREAAAPARAPLRTPSPPLTPRGELRKAQPVHQPSGIQVRSRQASPASSQQAYLTNMDAAATSPTSATQQQTAMPTSPRVLSARHPTHSPYRVDVVEPQQVYEVLTIQPPASAREAPAAATPSHPTAPRQSVPTAPSQGSSTVARACCLSELKREESKLDDAEMEVQKLLLHQHRHLHPHSQHHSWQRSNSGGHNPGSSGADDEPWLDEVYTQSHGRSTSPELGAGSRRRFYDIPALAPPEQPFAASAARVTPTMWETGLRKRHESPAQVVSRRASPTSSRRRRRTIYDGVQPRVNSQRHVGNERLARAEYEAATAAEARAREWLREHAEQRGTAGLSSGRGDPVSARQHPACHPSPSQRLESGMKWGRHSPLSKLLSPSPAPQRPAEASSLTPAKANGAWASTRRRRVHQNHHAGAAALSGTAQDSSAWWSHHPSTTASAITPAKRRLSTAESPHIVPRETVASRLRKVTSHRQRHFSEMEERENTYCARNWQPRTTFRTASVTGAMCASRAHPFEMAAVLQEQKQCTPADPHRGSDSSAYSAAMMMETSLLRRGDTAPQQEWSSPVHGTSRDRSVIPMSVPSHQSWYSAAATSTPKYNKNGAELVHVKLRTRARAAY